MLIYSLFVCVQAAVNVLFQEIDEEDEKAMAKFMSQEAPVKRTLADIIMSKITEKQTEIETLKTGNSQTIKLSKLVKQNSQVI